MRREITLLLVGDAGAGKTALINSFGNNPFMEDCRVAQTDCVDVTVDGQSFSLNLVETPGSHSEVCRNERRHAYQRTDVALVCYSVIEPDGPGFRDTFIDIYKVRLHELYIYCSKIPILLVACQIDQRHGDNINRYYQYEDGYYFATKCGLRYCETSAKTGQGIRVCLEEAIRMFLQKESNVKITETNNKTSSIVQLPPIKPEPPLPRMVEIEKSSFCLDWDRFMQDPKHCDVTFIAEAHHKLKAHSVFLCAASQMFVKILRVLGMSTSVTDDTPLIEFDTTYTPTDDQLRFPAVPGINEITTETDDDKRICHVTIELSVDISTQTISRMLKYVYTGMPNAADAETFSINNEELRDLRRVATMFDLNHLEFICSYWAVYDHVNEEEMNQLHDHMVPKIKELFFNKPEKADVVLKVDGSSVYAHKCILSARSSVFAAMFNGRFVEGQCRSSEVSIPNTDIDTLLAFLEYLYTDVSPIDDGKVIGILALADQYEQPRLITLCEHYMTRRFYNRKYFDSGNIATEGDVFGLLSISKVMNARQLTNWCLQLIASHYQSFEDSPELSQLTSVEKSYVDQHKWQVPVRYQKDIREYNRKYKNNENKWKCAIM